MSTISLLFYRGSGTGAWLERAACRFPCQALRDVPGHVAVRIGDDAVFEAVSSGVRRVGYGAAARRADLMREIVLTARSEAEVAAARGYAGACVGEAYSWGEIELTAWAWAAPGVVARFSKQWRERAAKNSGRHGVICSLFAMLALAHAGCRLHECVAPATTPNELMMRAEDYAWDTATKTSECAARSG